MSHVTIVEGTNITNLQAIKNLCKTKQWEFKQNQKTYKWYGRFMGDYPTPKGKNRQEWIDSLGKCTHAISIPGVNYEIGILEEKGHFSFLYDFWDKDLKAAIGGEEAEELSQGYAIENAKLQAYASGLVVKAITFDKAKNAQVVCARA